jgi:hypothetical protein
MTLPNNALCCLSLVACLVVVARPAGGAELTCADFDFHGPLGSEAAKIERIAANHFKVTLGHAPNQRTWCNNVQFAIRQHAKGNRLRLDAVFLGGKAFRFNQYHYSWSYDAKHWQPIGWEKDEEDSAKGDTLLFPPFTADTVWLGHQVPMSHEDVEAMMHEWSRHAHARVQMIGQSLGGRKICRLEITDPNGPHPCNRRWVHYFANQHPGEHYSQWRMVGMIRWLLSDEGADCRRRSISHFVLQTSPDGPSHGWYRVNGQGVDMNRSYFAAGSDPKKQAHEACLVQKDLEQLMKSASPVTDIWSMHTWSGIVEPLLTPGPEIAQGPLGPWTRFRDILQQLDAGHWIKPLAVCKSEPLLTQWTAGPHAQFGITAVLCEGAGNMYGQQENLESGKTLMRGIAEYYRGIKN